MTHWSWTLVAALGAWLSIGCQPAEDDGTGGETSPSSGSATDTTAGDDPMWPPADGTDGTDGTDATSGTDAGDGTESSEGTATTGDPPPACHQRQCEIDCSLATEDPGRSTTVAIGGPEICGPEAFDALTCQLRPACPSFSVGGFGVCEDDLDDPSIDDVAAFRCTFAGLRDRLPGVYTWTTCPGQIVVDTYTVQVFDDGTAIVQDEYMHDLGCGFSETRTSLVAADVLDACATTNDVATQVQCLSTWSEGCLPELDACP